jgi:uncharacterized protein
MRILNMLAVVSLMAGPAWAEEMKPTISITGEGRVEVAPDMATVTLGVTSEGDTARAALDANNAAIAAVIDRLKAAGIEGRDAQTSGLSLGPRYDYSRTNPDGSQQINGYVASNLVTVRVRALGQVGGVLDAAVTDGANTLNGLSFGLADATEPTDAARGEAVADARRKAELLTAAAGVKLGRILSIAEQGAFLPPVPMPMAEAAFGKAASVPVEAGELEVSAAVTIVFELAE